MHVIYIRNGGGQSSDVGGEPNIYYGDWHTGVLYDHTYSVKDGNGRHGAVTRGKRKGVKYIIKVL